MESIVYANTDQLDKVAEVVKGYPFSAVKTLNLVIARAGDTVRVELGRQIPKVFGAPQKEIKDALNSGRRKVRTVQGAVGEGTVSVEVVGRPLTAVRFKHTPSVPPSVAAKERAASGKKSRNPRRYQARVMIYRDRGMLTLGPVAGSDGKNKSVFLASTGTKNPVKVPYIFFYRTGQIEGGGREGIKPVVSLSVPQMVTNEKVAKPLTEKVNETISKRLLHELDQEFGNLGTNLKAGGTL